MVRTAEKKGIGKQRRRKGDGEILQGSNSSYQNPDTQTARSGENIAQKGEQERRIGGFAEGGAFHGKHSSEGRKRKAAKGR